MTENEDWARRRLHQLGDVDLPTGGSATADRVIARLHRQRRARAAWLGVVAAVVLAVSIPVALAATGAPSPRAAVAATGSASAGSPEPTSSGPPGPSADPGPMATRSGPATADLGVAYPFDLYTHCGIRTVRFAGREWTAVHPVPDPRRLPDSAGITTYDGYVSGTMTLVQPGLLRFTLTDPYAAGKGQAFDFVPAAAPPPGCD